MSDKLIQLFSDGLQVPTERLDEESSPDNLSEWDSVAAMNLVSLIEDTFAVELNTKEIMKMRTIGIAREVLTSKGVDLS
jgi:acyl carrier protein